MQLKLKKKPKNAVVLEGFPGFGLVGTITTEFLIDHLDTDLIGKIWINELPCMVAIHEGKVVEPVGIFYNKKYNLVIVHGITAVKGIEWNLADIVAKMANDIEAKEIISLEGVGSAEVSEKPKVFYYASAEENRKRFEKIKEIQPLKEGIIMGVTGAMLVRAEKIPTSCIFADTHSNMPDSKAAAKVIEMLDKYLGLEVDYKPLLEQAEKFEGKLKNLLEKSQAAASEREKKTESYIG